MNPNAQAAFPKTRFRRARQSAQTRALIRENRVSVEDLIWPVFICDGEGVEQPVSSMPGVVRRSVDKLVDAAKEAADLGIPAICLFPTPILLRKPKTVPRHGTQTICPTLQPARSRRRFLISRS